MKEENIKEESIKTTVSKNKEGYGYKYTDLAQIHDYLEANGMKYYQEIETNELNGYDYIMTYRFIDGQWEEKPKRGCRVVDATLSGIKNPAQEQGSALTYARRYSLLMAFGLATEDDDGACLTQKKEVTEEDAKSYVFSFGKHKDKKLTEVLESYPDYIKWILANSKDEELLECIKLLTGQVPLTEDEQKEILDLTVELNNLLEETNTDRDEMYKHYGVKTNKDMTLEQIRDAVQRLRNRRMTQCITN